MTETIGRNENRPVHKECRGAGHVAVDYAGGALWEQGLRGAYYAEEYRRFLCRLNQMTDEELAARKIPKPRIRVKAGSRYVPPGYTPPTQALRDAYEVYRKLPISQEVT